MLAHDTRKAQIIVSVQTFIFLPNVKLSDCRRKRKVERERHARIAAKLRAERRGGSSSPASGSQMSFALGFKACRSHQSATDVCHLQS